jgi:hypothetical protein
VDAHAKSLVHLREQFQKVLPIPLIGIDDPAFDSAMEYVVPPIDPIGT